MLLRFKYNLFKNSEWLIVSIAVINNNNGLASTISTIVTLNNNSLSTVSVVNVNEPVIVVGISSSLADANANNASDEEDTTKDVIKSATAVDWSSVDVATTSSVVVAKSVASVTVSSGTDDGCSGATSVATSGEAASGGARATSSSLSELHEEHDNE